MNICLKFADEAQAKAILFTEHPATLDADGITVTEAYSTPNFRNIDTIGQITKPTGELDDQGQPIVAQLDGWHVNVFLMPDEDGSALEPYTIHPQNPVRVWA